MWPFDTENPVAQGLVTSVGAALLIYIGKRVYNLELWDRLSTLLEDVKQIKKEVSFNSGESLKDVVTNQATQLNNISENLVRLDARQRGFIGSIARATFEADSTFSWTEGNPSIERLTGYGFTHLERRRWLSHVHDEDRGTVVREITSALADGREIQISFRFVRNGDGNIVPLRLVATPVFSPVKRSEILCWTGHLTREDDSDGKMLERRTAM
jgi:PAS domain S-box-containing protein